MGWELATGDKAMSMQVSSGEMAFSPDGRTLVSVERHGSVVRQLDLATGKERRPFESEARPGGVPVFSGDGRRLACLGGFGLICIWDAATGNGTPTLPGREYGAPLGFLDRGRTLALAADDGFALMGIKRAGDTATLTERRLVDGMGGVRALSPDGKFAVVSDASSRQLALWDVERGVGTHKLGQQRYRPQVQFSLDGKTVAASDSGVVTLCDVATGKLRSLPRGDKPGRSTSIAFAPDGKTLATGGDRDNAITFWDISSGKELHQWALPSDKYGAYAPTLQYSPSGKTVLIVRRLGDLQLWDVAAGKKFQSIKADGPAVFSPDGAFLATPERDFSVQLWEIATGQLVAELRGHTGLITGLRFSPDGRTLLTSSADLTALLWDISPQRIWTDAAPPQRLEGEALTRLWAELAEADAKKARRALAVLLAHPSAAVPFLQERLQPVESVPPAQIKAWIAQLDADEFQVREKASLELSNAGKLAERFIRETLKEKPSLELSGRLERLLAAMASDEANLPAGNPLRSLRAIQLLEAIGTPEARRLLEKLATGAPEAAQTENARASLLRLREQSDT